MGNHFVLRINSFWSEDDFMLHAAVYAGGKQSGRASHLPKMHLLLKQGALA